MNGCSDMCVAHPELVKPKLVEKPLSNINSSLAADFAYLASQLPDIACGACFIWFVFVAWY
jgi:hypothetical protein